MRTVEKSSTRTKLLSNLVLPGFLNSCYRSPVPDANDQIQQSAQIPHDNIMESFKITVFSVRYTTD